MIGLRGLGVDVGPIASAQFQGQINPSFNPTQYFQPSYMAPGQLSALPDWLYADSGFASQIAGLLGGSVVSAPPPGNYQGTGIPPAEYVQLPDGSMILPGNLFQPGSILSFQDECAAENYFAASIPGGTLSATCAGGGTGLTPAQMGTQTPAPPAPVVTPPAPVVIPTPVTHPAPSPAVAPAPITQSNGSTAILSPTVGSSTPPPATAPPSNSAGPVPAAASATSAAGCFNPLSQWLSMDSCLGPLGIVEWGLVAAGALFLLGGHRR